MHINNRFFKRKLYISLIYILIFSLYSCISTANQNNQDDKSLFRFVFLGDSRGDYKGNPPSYLTEEPLKKIVQQIINLNPKPKFVIFNGDMVAKITYKQAPEMIKKWQSIFLKPIQDKNILVYITPGNHVIDQNAVNKDNSIKYIELFRNYYLADNPMNGPSIYKGVTYSFNYANCHFVTVTSFVTHKGIDNTELSPKEFIQKKKDFEYFINKENRNWLIKDLKNDNSDFTIFFTHCPFYPVGPHYKDRKSLHAHPSNRDLIAEILINNNVDAFFASHEHLYARANLSSSNPASSGLNGSLLQVVVGSASAPLSSKKKRGNMIFDKYIKSFAFLIADVTRDSIKCCAYNENGVKIDNFSIVKKQRTQ
ncbi:MAG: metallophosphoesterase [Spirochaetota bacterium]|nr:metallophosphoesterase [Spirochaetota bacterium]